MKDIFNNIISSIRSIFNNTLQEVKVLFITIIINILNFLINHSKNFITFLFEKNIIHMCIGIIVATQIGTLTTSFNNNILQPIIDRSLIFYNDKLENYKYTILGIEFKLGKLIIDIIKILLILI